MERTCSEPSHDCGDWRCPFDTIRCGDTLPCRTHPARCTECRKIIAVDACSENCVGAAFRKRYPFVIRAAGPQGRICFSGSLEQCIDNARERDYATDRIEHNGTGVAIAQDWRAIQA